MTEPAQYEFGDVRVDLRRMVVTVGGEAAALEPKSLDVLLYLLRHSDRLVEKDELLNAIWGDTFVTPNVLTRAVAQVRKAIGDDAHDARYIETVARRGYRFLAPVTARTATDGAPAQAALEAAPPGPPPVMVPSAPPRSARRRAVPILVAASFVALAGGGWWAARRNAAADTPARAREFGLPIRLTSRPGTNSWPALSPDGRAVAYVSDRGGSFEIRVAGLAPGARELTITPAEMQAMHPSWSPDAQWIAFHSRTRRGVWVVPATGGVPRQLVDFGSDPAWSPQGHSIVFTSDAGGMVAQSALWTVRDDGTQLRELTRIGQPPGGHREPSWSADGRQVVFAVARGGWGQQIWTVGADGGAPRQLAHPRIGGSSPQLSHDGRALYWGSPSTGSTGGSLWRQALGDRGEPAGDAVEVLDLGGSLEGLSIGRDGSIAYGVAEGDMNLWSVPLGREGAAGEPARLTHDLVRTTNPDFSRDGRLAYAQFGPGRPQAAWLMSADGASVEPLAAESQVAIPQWTADGRILVTRLQPPPIAYCWLDPSTRRLTEAGPFEENTGVARVSPDGRELAYHVIEPTGLVNVWTRPLDGSGPRRRVTSDAEVISYPAWSPDGRWLAVEVKRGDQTHVAVVSKDGGPAEQLTSEDGQSWPHSWSPDGQRIAFAGERGGVWNVWIVSRVTRSLTQVTRFTSPSGYVRYPAWSPLGDRIVFERSIRQSTVWMARPNP